MSFYDIYSSYKEHDLDKAFSDVNDQDVRLALQTDELSDKQFLSFLSGAASVYIEDMAQKAHDITLRNFGRTMQLYTPMYLSNYCVNECVYCGFNSRNRYERRRLSPEAVEKEAKFISSTGLRHILILTGESEEQSPVSYIKDCVKILRNYFTSITIEVHALSSEGYEELIEAGVDGLTIYQEVYDEEMYSKVHPTGPKSDYKFRLDAPVRAAEKGMRSINVGALLGLSDWRKEAFFTGMHAKYLQDTFPDAEISVSVPRLRPHPGEFEPSSVVADSDLVQIILALRLFLPRAGITLSTRESPVLRENLLPLGITKMSAGSKTEVGGHTIKNDTSGESMQFKIFDERDVNGIRELLKRKGYQPVMQDWITEMAEI